MPAITIDKKEYERATERNFGLHSCDRRGSRAPLAVSSIIFLPDRDRPVTPRPAEDPGKCLLSAARVGYSLASFSVLVPLMPVASVESELSLRLLFDTKVELQMLIAGNFSIHCARRIAGVKRLLEWNL